MNLLKYKWTLVILFAIFTLSCDNDDPADPIPDPVIEPEPVSIALTLQTATLDGIDIDPLPDYSLTINFDKDGNPDGYTATGDAKYQPSIGTSGTFSVTNDQVTFENSGETQTVSISDGVISNETQTVSLQWEINKIDIGFDADEDGTYVYTLTNQ